MADLETVPAGSSNGSANGLAAERLAGGNARTAPTDPRALVKAPQSKRGAEPYLSVEIGAPLESDGTLPLRVAADAVDACRTMWTGICTYHDEALGKVSPVHTEVAAQLASRNFAYRYTQLALKRCDAALAEIRLAVKAEEAALARKTNPAQADVIGELRAQETRNWLRSLPAEDRHGAVHQALLADDVVVVAAALDRPALAGLGAEQAAMLRDGWRRRRGAAELDRLEVLERTAGKVLTAAQALQRRFDEAYAHGALDRIEASTKAA